MKRHEKGFSLLETMFALVILGVMAVPILSVIRQSNQNYEYATSHYQADILLSGLLREIEASLQTPECQAAMSFSDFISEFDTRYETERFAYSVSVGRVKQWRTDDAPETPPAAWNDRLAEYDRPAAMIEILYENGFSFRKGTGIIRDYNCYVEADTPGVIECAVTAAEADFAIHLVNNSSDLVILNLRLAEGIPFDRARVNSVNQEGNSIVRFLPLPEESEEVTLLTGSVFTKEQRVLHTLTIISD
jgi:prepilin-type N-terminal cleavage/methylation domain-containing protein